jgi:predicted NBD/HSP70 family sugar kinase
MTVEPGTFGSLRELNRLRVVDALRRQGTASRSELARLTGLSRTTVTTLVADLQGRGMIAEQEAGRTGPSGRGRPPVLLRLDASVGAALGIDFGHRHVRVAVADLSSTVLAERYVMLEVDDDAGTALDAAADLTSEVLAEAETDRSRLIGAGMALSGPIDRDTGTVASTVVPGWAGVNAGEELSRRLGVQVEVDNDANLGALAEVSFGAGRGLVDVIYVMMSAGVGAGLVLGGRLHHGSTGIAGELGHVQVRVDGAVCRCGNRGCLETYVSGPAIADLLRRSRGEELSLPDIIRLAHAGDVGCQRAIADAGRVLGRVVAAVCNVFNPDTVVVGGDLGEAGDVLLDPMREAVGRYAIAPAAEDARIVAGVLGERAQVLGALALALLQSEHLAARLAPHPLSIQRGGTT